MKRETAIVILGATLILVVPGVCGVTLVGLGSFAYDIQIQRLEEVEDVPPIVTLAVFEQIRRGMSYREVVEVIGDPGVAIDPSTAVEGTDGAAGTSRYVWQNSDASNMKAIFQDDQLLKKSQLFLE
jgi:hypothetical protein